MISCPRQRDDGRGGHVLPRRALLRLPQHQDPRPPPLHPHRPHVRGPARFRVVFKYRWAVQSHTPGVPPSVLLSIPRPYRHSLFGRAPWRCGLGLDCSGSAAGSELRLRPSSDSRSRRPVLAGSEGVLSGAERCGLTLQLRRTVLIARF